MTSCSVWIQAWRVSASPWSAGGAARRRSCGATPSGPPPVLDEAARLGILAAAVRAAIAVHVPTSVAVERVAFNRNQVSALTVARATGAVMVVAAEAGLAVDEYSPTQVKDAVTGMGNADKAQVHRALVRVHGLRDVPEQPDAADAVAVALTHLTGARARAAARAGSRAAAQVHTRAAARSGTRSISFLEGEVVEKGANRAVLNVAGVGYEVLVPSSVVGKLPAAGKRVRVHTRMVVRDDAMTLYGFTTTDERTLFDLLTGVSGVGPKVALSFLSALTPDALRRAVVAGDDAALTVVPGVGKKVAQRVVLDLRDKLGGEGIVLVEGPLAETREALIALGLTPAEAGDALSGVESEGRPVEDLLRAALQKVGR